MPFQWVEENVDKSVLNEAQIRAERYSKLKEKQEEERIVTVPIGDSRDYNPPLPIRNNHGLNYNYQGKVDNCVMGGLANAVFWLLGPDELDQLLKDHSLTVNDFWMKFVKKVNHVLLEYELKKYSCFDILQMDDAYPVVVQLRAADQSEGHAVCISKVLFTILQVVTFW